MNEKQFEIKYHKYKLDIYKICFSYLKNEFDTDDAIQETFIKFHRINKSFKTPTDEKRYLIRIAINVCHDIYRQRKKQPILKENFDFLDVKKEDFEDSKEIINLVDSLNSRLKDVIVLKYFQNYSYEEISKTLNISEEAARKRHQRAIEYLRKLMEDKESE